jgi:hypothetical protein
MIFAHTLHQVICGEKQQTRRLVKPDEIFDIDKQAVVKAQSRIMYKVGKSYAVQPNRGRKAVARILLTGIRKEQLSSITDADAVKEGFRSRDGFLATWHLIHGQDADLNCEVWVFEFELHSLIEEEIEAFYNATNTKNTSPHHSKNLSCSIEEVSGGGVYRWNHREWGVGTSLSDRLPILVPTSPV